jgi:putative phosphoesterase
MRIAVLSDTHVRPGGRPLPDRVVAELDAADLILHAGDVVDGSLLDQLATFAPVHAVLGNNDHGLEARLPERLQLDCGGVAIAMVHDSGARAGRPARMQRWFPEADVVVFGHSHEPVDELGAGAQRLFNPGSPTQRRRQPHPTMGRLTIGDGMLLAHEILRVDVASGGDRQP